MLLPRAIFVVSVYGLSVNGLPRQPLPMRFAKEWLWGGAGKRMICRLAFRGQNRARKAGCFASKAVATRRSGGKIRIRGLFFGTLSLPEREARSYGSREVHYEQKTIGRHPKKSNVQILHLSRRLGV